MKPIIHFFLSSALFALTAFSTTAAELRVPAFTAYLDPDANGD